MSTLADAFCDACNTNIDRINEDQLFGPRTIGHGSFSGCVFVIDPDAQLIITQVRKRSGPRSGEWSPKFFRTITAVMKK